MIEHIEKIVSIVDKYLNEYIELGLNSTPIKIHPLMADPNQNANEEWRTWFPINSTISDEELLEFEEKITHTLPDDYKYFLKHKYFYRLKIGEASFFSHPINIWQDNFLDLIFNYHPREYLIDKGYIPFADWSDWGNLCFDTNCNVENNNYPIVRWDHEIEDNFEEFATDFYSLLIKLDNLNNEIQLN